MKKYPKFTSIVIVMLLLAFIGCNKDEDNDKEQQLGYLYGN